MYSLQKNEISNKFHLNILFLISYVDHEQKQLRDRPSISNLGDSWNYRGRQHIIERFYLMYPGNYLYVHVEQIAKESCPQFLFIFGHSNLRTPPFNVHKPERTNDREEAAF